MDVLLILLGMLVGAIGLVMIIVNLIRKKPVKKYGATLLIGMVLLVTGGIMLDTDEEKSKEEPKTKVESAVNEKECKEEVKEKTLKTSQENDTEDNQSIEESELDKLQKLYLGFNDNITKEEIENAIKENNLFYNEHEFANGATIKIAYKEKVAKIKHAESGDYIEISFNKDLEVEHIEYFNDKKFITLIDYRKGTYWSFRDQPEYKGYYINGYNDKLGTIKIKYDNGNETEADYLQVKSKEEQLDFLLNYKN